MTSPEHRYDCPNCKGEGVFYAPPCPHPPDNEVDCRHCANEDICGKDETCGMCNGSGWIESREYDATIRNYYCQ